MAAVSPAGPEPTINTLVSLIVSNYTISPLGDPPLRIASLAPPLPMQEGEDLLSICRRRTWHKLCLLCFAHLPGWVVACYDGLMKLTRILLVLFAVVGLTAGYRADGAGEKRKLPSFDYSVKVQTT